MAQILKICYTISMPSDHLLRLRHLCKWSTITLGILCLVTVSAVVMQPEGSVHAIILRQKEKTTPWRIFQPGDVENGEAVPANTNIVFHLPIVMPSIDREVLLGQRGKEVRYWGYCFPQNYDPKVVQKRDGLPGQIFLSEKERAVRERTEALKMAQSAPAFSPLRFPTEQELNPPTPQKSVIRNQIDTFTGGMMCYLMSEAPLSIGLDPDGDLLNNELEREIGTNPQTPDTDGDGIWDGVEKMSNVSPLLRDTDSDGLIDGLEDKNWNGKVDANETDPRQWDTDRDGLCDGICRVKLSNGQSIFLGEDVNLNGKMDSSETNPLIPMTHAGINDYQFRLNCLFNKKSGGSASCS